MEGVANMDRGEAGLENLLGSAAAGCLPIVSNVTALEGVAGNR